MHLQSRQKRPTSHYQACYVGRIPPLHPTTKSKQSKFLGWPVPGHIFVEAETCRPIPFVVFATRVVMISLRAELTLNDGRVAGKGLDSMRLKCVKLLQHSQVSYHIFFIHQRWLGPKTYMIKMSSFMLFTFNDTPLFTVTLEDKAWVCGKEVYKALQYNKKTANIIKVFCSQENYTHICQLSEFIAAGNFLD